ncbi:MAG TPA: hypothetical protein VHD62_04810 [Opitutaceae bacterium]|nr:hypothetical protein [Opitutaceae bacterium]
MPRSPLTLCWFAGALCAPAFGADAETSVRHALQDFLEQPNYTWSVGNTRGVPEAGGDDAERAVGGQHEKGGYTKVNFVRGPHIPRDEWPVAKPWPGIMDREDYWSSRWIFWTPDGWQTLRQLPVPLPPNASPARSSGSGLGIRLKPISVNLGSQFGFSRPDREVAIMLPHLEEIEELRPGVYRATLDHDGTTGLIAFPSPGGPFLPMPTVENASATATFVVRDGQLARYEIACDGTWSFVGRKWSRSFTLIRDLNDLGTTVIEIPAEVRRKFGDEVKADAPETP